MLIPSKEILHIFTPDEFLENYGAESFKEYMSENGIVIQSTKQIKGGKKRRHSLWEAARAWNDVLLSLLKNDTLNLGQMMRNYQHAPALQSRTDIAARIVSAINETMEFGEFEREAVILGICMLFQDDGENITSNSLIRILEERFSKIMDKQPTQSSYSSSI